jgi:hypothetical protein
MIDLYEGLTKIASLNHRDLHRSSWLATERRSSLSQPPGADEANLKGDNVEKIQEFEIVFVVDEPGIVGHAVNETLKLRKLLEQATSLHWVEANLWRALRGGNEKIAYLDPLPFSDRIMDNWTVAARLRPKFARATVVRAERYSEYLQVKDRTEAFVVNWAGSGDLAGNAGELAGLAYYPVPNDLGDTDPEVLNPPLNVRLTAGDGQVFLNFDPPASGTPLAYDFALKNSGGIIHSGALLISSVPFTMTVTNGVSVFAEVSARYAGGSSDAIVSNSVTAQAAGTAFNPPRNVSLTAGDGQVFADFDAPLSGTPSLYRLNLIKNVGGEIVYSTTLQNPPSSPLVIASVNGLEVALHVRAEYGGGNSGYVSSFAVTPQSQTPPPGDTTNNTTLINRYRALAARPTSIGNFAPIYVSKPLGNDANNGSTEALAVRTLGRANQLQAATPNSKIVLLSSVDGYESIDISGGRTYRICSKPGFHFSVTGASRPKMTDTTYYLGPAKHPDYTLFVVNGSGGRLEMHDVSFTESFGDAVNIRGNNINVYGERVAFYNNEGHGFNVDGSGNVEFNVCMAYYNFNRRWFTNNPSTGSGDWSDGIKSSGNAQLRIRFGVIYGNSDDGIDFWGSSNRGSSQLLEYVYSVRNGVLPPEFTRQNNTRYEKHHLIVRTATSSGGHTPANTIDNKFVYRCIVGGVSASTSPTSWPRLNAASTTGGKAYLDSQPTVVDGGVTWQVYAAWCGNGNGLKAGGASPADKDLDVRYCVFADNAEGQANDNHGANIRFNHCTIIIGNGKTGFTIDKAGTVDQIRNSYHDGIINTYNGSTEPQQSNNSRDNASSKFLSLALSLLPNDPTISPLEGWWWAMYISDAFKPSASSSLKGAASDGTDIGALQSIDIATTTPGTTPPPTSSSRAKLIFSLGQYDYPGNTDPDKEYNLAWLRQSANRTKLATLPFDGYVIDDDSGSTDLTYWQNGREFVNGLRAFTLAEMQAKIDFDMPGKDLYLLVSEGQPDYTSQTVRDNLKTSYQNLLIAMSQRTSWKGIVLDNEQGYGEQAVGAASQALQDGAYIVGQERGTLFNNHLPNGHFFMMHGPYRYLPASDPGFPQLVRGAGWDPSTVIRPSNRLFMGMMDTRTSGKMMDGGQLYNLTDNAAYEASKNFRRNNLDDYASVSPQAVKDKWAASSVLSVDFMTYACNFKKNGVDVINLSNYPGRQEAALNQAETMVVLYATPSDNWTTFDLHNWLNGTPDAWAQAVIAGIPSGSVGGGGGTNPPPGGGTLKTAVYQVTDGLDDGRVYGTVSFNATFTALYPDTLAQYTSGTNDNTNFALLNLVQGEGPLLGSSGAESVTVEMVSSGFQSSTLASSFKGTLELSTNPARPTTASAVQGKTYSTNYGQFSHTGTWPDEGTVKTFAIPVAALHQILALGSSGRLTKLFLKLYDAQLNRDIQIHSYDGSPTKAIRITVKYRE